MLVIILLVIIGILGISLLLINCQVRKMIREAEEKDNKYSAEKIKLQNDLYDCQDEKRELERALAEMEERAKNAEQQRDLLKNGMTVPMGPAGWNVVFADQEKKESEEK